MVTERNLMLHNNMRNKVIEEDPQVEAIRSKRRGYGTAVNGMITMENEVYLNYNCNYIIRMVYAGEMRVDC